MTPNEYQKLASRTMPTTDPLKAGLHGSLGLVAEWQELDEAKDELFLARQGDKRYRERGISLALDHVEKELGDCWWMAAEIATANGIYLEDVFPKEPEFLHAGTIGPMERHIARVAGVYQKTFQGHRINREMVKAHLTTICKWLHSESCDCFTTEEIWELNIQKLKARYPDGFDVEKSLHRAEGDV